MACNPAAGRDTRARSPARSRPSSAAARWHARWIAGSGRGRINPVPRSDASHDRQRSTFHSTALFSQRLLRGHDGQFATPGLSARSAFSGETFAGRCGNEKDAPPTAVHRLPAVTWSAVCYLAAASKLPDSSGAATGCPSWRHQSNPPSNSLVRNPSRASFASALRRGGYSRSHRNKRHKPCRGRGAPSFPSSFHDVGS